MLIYIGGVVWGLCPVNSSVEFPVPWWYGGWCCESVRAGYAQEFWCGGEGALQLAGDVLSGGEFIGAANGPRIILLCVGCVVVRLQLLTAGMVYD